MKEQNDYRISNPDGVSQAQFEQKQTFVNDKPHTVSEVPLSSQSEFSSPPETFAASGPPGQSTAAATAESGGQTAETVLRDPTVTSAAATATTTSATAASAATAATATTASVAVSSAVSGIGAVAGTIAATVVTAVIVVAVYISTLTVNLSLLFARMDSLVFEVEMRGAQEEDFETPILVTLTGADDQYQVQELRPDSLYLSFYDLAPGQEYTVRVANENNIFFEKTYITASEPTENGFIEAWHEGNNVFIFVGGVELGKEQFYTVSARDASGNTLFVQDSDEPHGNFKFTVTEPLVLYFALSVDGKVRAVTQIDMINGENGDWIWSDDCSEATLVLRDENGEQIFLPATVTSETLFEPTCEEEGEIRYVATVETEDGVSYSDERLRSIPALGHDFVDHTFEWRRDPVTGAYLADLVLICARDPEHTERIEAEVTQEGNLYVATAEWNGEHYSDEISGLSLALEGGTIYLRPNDYVQEDRDGTYTTYANTLTSPYLISGEYSDGPAIEIYNFTDLMFDTDGRGNGRKETFYLIFEDGFTASAPEESPAIRLIVADDTDLYILNRGSATVSGNAQPAFLVEGTEGCTVNIYVNSTDGFETFYCIDSFEEYLRVYEASDGITVNFYMNNVQVNEFGEGPLHEHAFLYSADGNTITAVCTNDGCDLPDQRAVLTLYAPAITTEGDFENRYATLDAEPFNAATGLEITESDIRYFTVEGTPLEEAPTEAGDYIAQLTVEGATATVNYTIQTSEAASSGP